MKTVLTTALAMLLVSPLMAQQTKMLTADKGNDYGIVYSLPVTSLSIEVTARHVARTAGPYYQYSRKYLGAEDPVRENSDTWTITGVRVMPYGVPDRETQYVMQAKSGSPVSVCVDNDGMLLSINCESEDPQAPEWNEGTTVVTSPIPPREYLKYVGEDFIASQSSAKQAQMLSESLMEIREAKIALTRGTAETMPTDGRQLELMLKSLEHQEAAVTAAFLGTVSEETVVRTFSFTPDEEGEYILFRMSDFAGFVDADDYSGDPFIVKVGDVAKGELPVDAKGEAKKLPKDAVIYKVPGSAVISLSCLGKTLWQRELQFGQYGMEFGLNPSMFTSRKERSVASFDPVTGALLEIRSE